MTSRAKWTVAVGLWTGIGCAPLTLDLTALSAPVMVSPIIRVGDTCTAAYIRAPDSAPRAADYQSVNPGRVCGPLVASFRTFVDMDSTSAVSWWAIN